MGRPRMVPLLVAITLVAATISSAQARDGHHPIGGSVTTDVPPGGYSTVTSADADTTQGDIDVILNTTDTSDSPVFAIMAFTMMQVKATKRTAACLMIASSFVDTTDWGSKTTFAERDVYGRAPTRALAIAALCLRIVRLMAEIEAEGPPARARAGACGVLPIDMKVTTARTEEGDVVVTPTTGARDATKRVGFKASCAGKEGRIKLHLHMKKGKTFRKAVGKQAQLGIASPPSAPDSAQVKVTFRSPR